MNHKATMVVLTKKIPMTIKKMGMRKIKKSKTMKMEMSKRWLPNHYMKRAFGIQ